MYVLGISAYDRDSAACLLKDGEIVAAAQEERFTRKLMDASFPVNAIYYCLNQAEIEAVAVDMIAFYEEPWQKIKRLKNSLKAGKSFSNLFKLYRYVWREKHLQRSLQELFGFLNKPLLFVEQVAAHAAQAFYLSPFEQAAVMVLDDEGDNEVEWLGMGMGNKLEVLQTQTYPHSIGKLTSVLTEFLGLRPLYDEDKVLFLATKGEPKYKEKILKELFNLQGQGVFELADKYLKNVHDPKKAKFIFEEVLKIPVRKKKDPFTQIYFDVAASWQAVVQEISLQKSIFLFEHYQLANLCLSGEFAANFYNNSDLRQKSPFQEVWVQPAAGKAGGAMGAALYAWHYFQNNPRKVAVAGVQNSLHLGPAYTGDEIKEYLEKRKIPYREYAEDQECFTTLVERLNSGHSVGWFSGRMDFGRNNFKGRSILFDPCRLAQNLIKNKDDHLGQMTTLVLKEASQEYFEMPVEEASSMYVVLAKDKAKKELPELTLTDGKVRVQLIDEKQDPRLYKLLKKYQEKTGLPALFSISFNTADKPIVCSPQDALQEFIDTDLDFLLLEKFLISKKGG